MSNLSQRQPFGLHACVSTAASGSVAGLGVLGYERAVSAAATLAAARVKG